jgi:tripartite-type tricarboxylate transporter receptor subunit TctC
MNLSRRRFLHIAAAAGTATVAPGRVSAQAYPARPLRWVVGFPPGGGADIVSRIMAPWLAERLGQPVVIENKPGASANISVQTVVNSPPDGYTLLFVPASAAVNVTLFDNLPFNLLRDIAPVSGLSPNSSPMPRPIRARSASARSAPARRRTSPASSSR